MTTERDILLMRGLAWTAGGLALLALGLTFAERGSVRWTAWALPLVVAVNAGLMGSGLSRSRPRMAAGIALITGVAAFAILGGLLAAHQVH